MLDLLITNATLPDGRTGMDIACASGLITEIAPAIKGETLKTIDAKGYLVSPPFIDSHFHMDATLSLGIPRLNMSGTLLEGIGLWGELKPQLTHEAIIERALRYCDLAVSEGMGAIRTHVDVCDDRLLCVEALLEVKRNCALYRIADRGLPAGWVLPLKDREADLIRALDIGVDVVGGIPHFERTMADGAASLKELCEIAAKRGLLVDIHCDETDDPLSRHVEVLAYETQRLGLQGRVVGSHLTSMHSMDNYYVSKLIPLMVESQLHATPNPLINITIQGRHDTYPKRRGLTRIPECAPEVINISFGHDCVMDPWYPLGQDRSRRREAWGIRRLFPWICASHADFGCCCLQCNAPRRLRIGKRLQSQFCHLAGKGSDRSHQAQGKPPCGGARRKNHFGTAERISKLQIDGRPKTVNGADYAPKNLG